MRERFLRWLAAEPATYPFPVVHCSICDFLPLCTAQWQADDHLMLVANVRRDQITRLGARGITTLAQLARARDDERPPEMHPATFDALRDQATLQLYDRETDEHRTHLLPPEPQRGFALLPPPSAGDLFFDIEGDPFWQPDRGLEYLFGVLWRDGAETRFRAFWAHDCAQERRALEELVDFFYERIVADPNMNIYYYASY